MNVKKLLIAFLAVGVVMNIIDYVMFTVIMKESIAANPILRQDASPVWFIIIDFVSALVVVWVFDKVRGSFKAGVAGGALYGFYAGVLLNFPTWIGLSLIIKGFEYKQAWFWTGYGVIWMLIAGCIAGFIYKPKT